MKNEYELLRSRRSTVSITVDGEGRLIVRAPKYMPKRTVDAFVAERGEWIARARVKQAARRVSPHEYSEGERFMYRGRELTLMYGESTRIDGDALIAAPPYRENVRRLFDSEAARLLPEAVAKMAELSGADCPIVKLTNAKTMWGSCTPSGDVRLNRRLVMAPESALDYVALHELTHLKRRDHSAEFWALVEEHMPDWRERRKWLKDNGRFLTLD